MSQPKISVIIPVYNAEKYLAECLDSVIMQTMEEIEIICVNDGSKDGSLGILEKYSKKDCRIRVIDQKNRGVIAARMTGFRQSRGEYIAFMDNDDLLTPAMYEKMYNLAQSNDSDIVICNYALYPKKAKNKDIWYRPYYGDNDWKFISHNTTPWNKIIRRSFLEKINLCDLYENMGESAYSIVLASTKKISTIDEPLYRYRVGHASVSVSYDKIENYRRTVEWNWRKCKRAEELNLEPETVLSFWYGYLYYNLVLMSIAARNNNMPIYKEAKKTVKTYGFFSKKYRKFFRYNLSLYRRLFFAVLIYPNFFVAKNTSRIVLR